MCSIRADKVIFVEDFEGSTSFTLESIKNAEFVLLRTHSRKKGSFLSIQSVLDMHACSQNNY